METKNLAKKIVSILIKNHLKIAFAESMTGGLLASEIISVVNASKVIEESYVVYSNQAKQTILNCKKQTIDRYSVYSHEVVQEMVNGLKQISNGDILIAVSGIAGPSVEKNKTIGDVFLGIYFNHDYYAYHFNLSGDRNQIRQKCVEEVFLTLINLIQ